MIEALDSETITVSTAVIGLTVAKFTARVKKVQIYVDATNGLRYWTSGKAPTASEGIPAVGQLLEFDITEARSLKMIRSGGSDAKAHVQYLDDRA